MVPYTNWRKCKTNQININGEIVKRSNIIKYLGAFLDELLNLIQHITKKCKKAMYNWQCIRMIRPILTERATSTLLLRLVVSHLDYANGIMIGLPETNLKELQLVQNMSAKLVKRKGKLDSATECMESLHWLPIKYRIQHNILTLVFKAFKGES